jgi:hypothetical protein
MQLAFYVQLIAFFFDDALGKVDQDLHSRAIIDGEGKRQIIGIASVRCAVLGCGAR